MLSVFIASSMSASLAGAQPPLLRQLSCILDTGFRSFSPGNTVDAGYIDKDCMCASDDVAFEACSRIPNIILLYTLLPKPETSTSAGCHTMPRPSLKEQLHRYLRM